MVSPVVRRYYTPVATVIFQTGNGRSNVPHAEIVLTDTGDDYIDLRLEKAALGAGVTQPSTSDGISAAKLHFLTNS